MRSRDNMRAVAEGIEAMERLLARHGYASPTTAARADSSAGAVDRDTNAMTGLPLVASPAHAPQLFDELHEATSLRWPAWRFRIRSGAACGATSADCATCSTGRCRRTLTASVRSPAAFVKRSICAMGAAGGSARAVARCWPTSRRRDTSRRLASGARAAACAARVCRRTRCRRQWTCPAHGRRVAGPGAGTGGDRRAAPGLEHADGVEHPRGASPFVGPQLRYPVSSAHGWLGGASGSRRVRGACGPATPASAGTMGAGAATCTGCWDCAGCWCAPASGAATWPRTCWAGPHAWSATTSSICTAIASGCSRRSSTPSPGRATNSAGRRWVTCA